MILLISASWVSGIAGVSHRGQAFAVSLWGKRDRGPSSPCKGTNQSPLGDPPLCANLNPIMSKGPTSTYHPTGTRGSTHELWGETPIFSPYWEYREGSDGWVILGVWKYVLIFSVFPFLFASIIWTKVFHWDICIHAHSAA
jgi:hypothetical protein